MSTRPEPSGTNGASREADRSASGARGAEPRAGISRRRPPIAADRAIARHLRTISKRPGTSQILSRLADAVVTFDREWRYVYLNRQAEMNLQRPVRELLGLVVWDVFGDAREFETYRRYLLAMERQEEDVFEEYLPMFGRWYEQRLLPSADGLTVIARDITDWREVKIERTRLEHAFAALRGGDADGRAAYAAEPGGGNPMRTFTTLFARAGKCAELSHVLRHSDVFSTVTQSAGALSVELQIADDPTGPLVVTALWRSAADHEHWLAHPARRQLLGELEPLLEEARVDRYEVVKRASYDR